MEDQLQCMEFTVTEDMEEERIDKLLSSLMDSFSQFLYSETSDRWEFADK